MKNLCLRNSLLGLSKDHGIVNNPHLSAVLREISKLVPAEMNSTEDIISAVFIAAQRIGMRSKHECVVDYEAILSAAASAVTLTMAEVRQ